MKILVFKTDIRTKRKIKMIEPVLDHHMQIFKWSVDTEDIDNVLRVEALGEIEESDIIRLVMDCGFYCEELPD